MAKDPEIELRARIAELNEELEAERAKLRNAIGILDTRGNDSVTRMDDANRSAMLTALIDGALGLLETPWMELRDQKRLMDKRESEVKQ